jgi:hypothetical protein
MSHAGGAGSQDRPAGKTVGRLGFKAAPREGTGGADQPFRKFDDGDSLSRLGETLNWRKFSSFKNGN